MRNRFIVIPVIASTIATAGYSNFRINSLEKQNNALKNQLEDQQQERDKYETINKTVDEIKEINAKNIDLVVFESNKTDYNLDVKDNGWFDLNANINTTFKYMVCADLSRCDISFTQDKVFVHVNPEDISLKEISISQPNITYDTNLVTRFQGKRLIDLEKEIICHAYDDIEKIVHKDYTLNEELFKMNLINKLNRLYNSTNVEVVFK